MTVFDYSVFESTFQKVLKKSPTTQKFLAESTVSITSILQTINWGEQDVDGHYESKIILLSKKKDILLKLALASYELHENLGFQLRLAIDEVCNQRGFLQDIKFIISSRVNRDLWLNNFFANKNGFQIFGTFFDTNEWSKVLTSFKIKRIRNHSQPTDSQPQKRTIGVGYKDKGTLPKSHGVGSLKDFSDSTLQSEVEQNREKADDLYKILEGFFW